MRPPVGTATIVHDQHGAVVFGLALHVIFACKTDACTSPRRNESDATTALVQSILGRSNGAGLLLGEARAFFGDWRHAETDRIDPSAPTRMNPSTTLPLHIDGLAG